MAWNGEFINGMTQGFLAPRGYFLTKKAEVETAKIADLGLNYVALVVNQFQETYASTRIFPDNRRTVSDRELIAQIDRLHRAGIKVMLKPMIEPLDSLWRGFIRHATGNIIAEEFSPLERIVLNIFDRPLHFPLVARRPHPARQNAASVVTRKIPQLRIQFGFIQIRVQDSCSQIVDHHGFRNTSERPERILNPADKALRILMITCLAVALPTGAQHHPQNMRLMLFPIRIHHPRAGPVIHLRLFAEFYLHPAERQLFSLPQFPRITLYGFIAALIIRFQLQVLVNPLRRQILLLPLFNQMSISFT